MCYNITRMNENKAMLGRGGARSEIARLVVTRGQISKAKECGVDFAVDTSKEDFGAAMERAFGPAVDTVGEGDSFPAAFVASILKGGSLREAAEAGNRLAGWVASRPGAIPAGQPPEV